MSRIWMTYPSRSALRSTSTPSAQLPRCCRWLCRRTWSLVRGSRQPEIGAGLRRIPALHARSSVLSGGTLLVASVQTAPEAIGGCCCLRPRELEHGNGADSSSLAFVLGKARVAPRLLGVDAVAFT